MKRNRHESMTGLLRTMRALLPFLTRATKMTDHLSVAHAPSSGHPALECYV